MNSKINDYNNKIHLIEEYINESTKPDLRPDLLYDAQVELDTIADKYQYDEAIGRESYKLYELQALIHYYNYDDAAAISFLDQAVEARGENYDYAENLRNMFLHDKQNDLNDDMPLELQSIIVGLRGYAICMTVVSIINIITIPWAFFYITMAIKLRKKQVPSTELILAAAIITLPFIIALIPLFIDIEFWRIHRKLKNYEEDGRSAFVSDEEWRQIELRSKRSRKIAFIVLGVLFVLLVLLTIDLITQN